ncbi:MAG: hypothetical protein WBC63_00080 [Candidatus Bipolaricaulia bacterium]
MGEVLIQRDERNRVTGLIVRDVVGETVPGASALHLMQAVTTSLVDYLHVRVESTVADAAELVVDRCDTHLDRELDAVLETLVIGLKMLSEEYPADLIVEEATISVEV